MYAERIGLALYADCSRIACTELMIWRQVQNLVEIWWLKLSAIIHVVHALGIAPSLWVQNNQYRWSTCTFSLTSLWKCTTWPKTTQHTPSQEKVSLNIIPPWNPKLISYLENNIPLIIMCHTIFYIQQGDWPWLAVAVVVVVVPEILPSKMVVSAIFTRRFINMVYMALFLIPACMQLYIIMMQ